MSIHLKPSAQCSGEDPTSAFTLQHPTQTSRTPFPQESLLWVHQRDRGALQNALEIQEGEGSPR